MRRASRTPATIAAASLVIMGLPLAPAAAGTGPLTLIIKADGWVSYADDGTRMAFTSSANNLVSPPPPAGTQQVYVKDLVSGAISLASARADGTPANGTSTWLPELSHNGRFLTFTTDATNLDAGDTDDHEDVYVKDLDTGALMWASSNSAGEKDVPSQTSWGPAPISDDGTTLLFTSYVPCVWDPFTDDCLGGEPSAIYAKDLTTGTRSQQATQVTGTIFADLSADGQYAAIAAGDRLTPDDTDSSSDVFLRELSTGATELASPGLLGAYFPSISADGQRVAYQAENQVHLWDHSAATVTLVSQPSSGPAANDIAQDVELSGDGGYAVFSSFATNLDPGDTDSLSDVYLKDLSTGELRLISVNDAGTKGNADSWGEGVANGGGAVFFGTRASNLDSTPVNPGDYLRFRKDLVPAGPADTNPQDGIADSLQPPGTAPYEFVDSSTTPPTVGRLVDSAGLTGRITDAADPADGVLVTVDPGTGGPAVLEVCELTVHIAAGSEVVLTCGSLIVAPVSGDPVEVVLDGGDIVVTVPAGSSVEIDDTAAGATLTNVSGGGVTVTINGTTTPVPDGAGPNDYATDTTAPELAWHGWYNSWLVGPTSPAGPNASVQVECLDDSEVTATFVVRSSTDDVVHEGNPLVVPAGGCSALQPPSPDGAPVQFQWDGTDSGGSPVPDGNYPFVVRVEDAAGSAAELTGAIFVGTPVTVSSPQPDDVVYGSSLDVEITVSDPDWTRVSARVGGCAIGNFQVPAFTSEIITLNTVSCPPDSYELVLSGYGPFAPYQRWEQRIPIEIGVDDEGPTVTLEFPDPPASGWFTAPPVGTLTATDPSGVASLDCYPVPGVTLSGLTAIGSDEATATVTVDVDGITEVGCSAEDPLGNVASSRGVTVRVDPGADPNVNIAFVVETSPPVPGAFRDITALAVTSGHVVDSNGLAVTITDEPDPAGVRVEVGAGTGQATIWVCGLTAKVSAGSTVVFTCGSLIVAPVSGPPVEIVLDDGDIVVTVAAGSSVKIEDTDEGATLDDVSGSGVTVTVNNGTPTPVTGPTDITPITWVITGFEAPVDNAPVLNKGKAGRAVPLKWHLADADGNPVTDLTEAQVVISVKHLECGLSTTSDVLEQTYAGGSGLINHGNGDYQLNWKTSSKWAKSCQTMTLTLGGSAEKQALFSFTK